MFGAFEVVFGNEQESEHVTELLEAAAQQLGGAFEEHEKGFTQDLLRTIKATGVAATWDKAGITPKALAEHLLAVSHGLKQRRTVVRITSAACGQLYASSAEAVASSLVQTSTMEPSKREKTKPLKGST